MKKHRIEKRYGIVYLLYYILYQKIQYFQGELSR